MKKYLWIFIFLILIIGIGVFFFNRNNSNGGDSYIAERTVTEINNNEIENFEINEKNETTQEEENKIEEKIADFSTKLPNDTEARDSNIKLACKTLNDTVVKSKETFSLWDVLGCPTKEKGYQKAKTFTSDGEITQSYGGGICQISTTIYNTVLKVDDLEVTERHEHSREVPYIEDGKDAAVSYDSADLKFKNNLDYDIKIEAKVEEDKVKIELIRI